MFNNKIYSHLINISLKYNKNFISFNNNFRKIENSIYYEKSFENTYNQNKTEYSIFKLSTFHNTIKKNFFQKTKFLQNINKTENFYNVLGVDRNSTNDQIKQAYLKLAKQFHPDVNKEIDADEKFKNITLAYEALSNKKNRELYDATMDVDIKKNNWNYWKEEEEFARKDNARAKQDRKGGFYKNAYDSNFWKGEREDFEEKFYKEYENIFGSGWKESKSQKGEDILVKILKSFLGFFKCLLNIFSLKSQSVYLTVIMELPK